MKLKEFLSQDEWSIVKENVIYNFKKYKGFEWLIEVSLPGQPYDNEPNINHWHSATTLVMDYEAAQIYVNLLNYSVEA